MFTLDEVTCFVLYFFYEDALDLIFPKSRLDIFNSTVFQIKADILSWPRCLRNRTEQNIPLFDAGI